MLISSLYEFFGTSFRFAVPCRLAFLSDARVPLNTYMVRRDQSVWQVVPAELAELELPVRLAGLVEGECDFDAFDRGKREEGESFSVEDSSGQPSAQCWPRTHEIPSEPSLPRRG